MRLVSITRTIRLAAAGLAAVAAALAGLCAANCAHIPAAAAIGCWFSAWSGVPCNPATLGLLLTITLGCTALALISWIVEGTYA